MEGKKGLPNKKNRLCVEMQSRTFFWKTTICWCLEQRTTCASCYVYCLYGKTEGELRRWQYLPISRRVVYGSVKVHGARCICFHHLTRKTVQSKATWATTLASFKTFQLTPPICFAASFFLFSVFKFFSPLNLAPLSWWRLAHPPLVRS